MGDKGSQGQVESLVRMDATFEDLRVQAQGTQICSLSILCAHKACLVQRVKMMFTIVRERRWIHKGPDHLFTTGL